MAAPTVSSISPSAGSTGTSVTISGAAFTDATAVDFGGVAAPGFTVNSDAEIVVQAPAPNASGSVDVTVTTADGTSVATAADLFNYDPLPAVTGLSPASGDGGATVTVTGTGFTGATSVTFGGTAGADVAVISDTQLTVTVPAPNVSGSVHVVVVNAVGASATSDADQFTFALAPARTIDPTRWSSLLSPVISPSAPLRKGNAVTYLIDGTDTFAEMARVMNLTADGEYIYLLGWQLVDDFDMSPPASSQFKDIVTAAAGRGVQIRAMLWKQFQDVNKPQVDFINALANGAAILDNETPSKIFGAHHQKVLVVKCSEGLIAFCGGIDINSDRVPGGLGSGGSGSGGISGSSGAPDVPDAGDASDGAVAVMGSGASSSGGAPLHDVHCKIVGPAAWDCLLTFIRRWDHHPDSAALDAAKAALVGRGESVPGPAATPSSTGAACSVVIGRTFTPVTPGTTIPKERDIRALLLAAIANARSFIYLEDQYLISAEAAAALNARIPSLAHVTIVVSASEITVLPCKWTYRDEFINAVTAGLSPADAAKVRVFELVTPPASTPPVFGSHTYVHAKMWVFDDELAVIGSANCNRRGWESDSEANAFIFDDAVPAGGAPSFAQKLRCDLWAEHLGVPASSVTDGVASVSMWASPPSTARVLAYAPAAGNDSAVLACGTAFARDKIDPPLP